MGPIRLFLFYLFHKMCFFTIENGFNELVSPWWVGHKRFVPLFVFRWKVAGQVTM